MCVCVCNNGTVVINNKQFLYVFFIFASQSTHLVLGMTSVSVYHGQTTTTSHGVNKGRKENPQKLTQLSSRSHPNISWGKGQHKRQPGEQQFPTQVVTG